MLTTTETPAFRPRKARFARLFALPAAAVALWGCSGGSTPDYTTLAGPKEAAPVMVAAAVQKAMPVQIRAFGNAEAFATVNVKSQVTGALSIVHIKEGQDVRKGDLLFTINPQPFQAALALAQANVSRDTAQAKLAHIELSRTEELYKKDADTKDDFDKASASADSADAVVKSDQAAADLAAVQLSWCYIASPIDGRAGSFLIDQGNYIKANDVPIIAIDEIKPIYVTFAVPQRFFAEIQQRMAQGKLQTIVTVPHDSRPPIEGVVSFVDNNVDAATGTMRLKAIFDNADERLWPGLYVDVDVILDTRPDAVVIPSAAVQSGQAGDYVFVVKSDNTVENRPVVLGDENGGETIVEKGVSAGEVVVTDGQMLLLPGSKVLVKNAQPAQSESPK